MKSRLIRGRYFEDLMAQPAALRQVQGSLAAQTIDPRLSARLRGGDLRRVVLTGMGSSLHALYPLHRAFGRAGIASHWIETAELLLGFDSLYARDSLVIAVSQSGESAEIVRLAERATAFGEVIGVTNNRQSALGGAAKTTLALEVGLESSVSCKTYLSTLAVLRWLEMELLPQPGGARRSLEEIAEAQSAVDRYLARWADFVDDLAPLIEPVKTVFVTGRGDALATAGTGGLILKEATRLPAEGMSAAAFRHGPFEMVGDEVLVLIIEGDQRTSPLHRRLAEDIQRSGGRVALIGSDTAGPAVFRLPDVPTGVRPIVEILPIQMLSLVLAMRGGFEAGKFERASKITNVA